MGAQQRLAPLSWESLVSSLGRPLLPTRLPRLWRRWAGNMFPQETLTTTLCLPPPPGERRGEEWRGQGRGRPSPGRLCSFSTLPAPSPSDKEPHTRRRGGSVRGLPTLPLMLLTHQEHACSVCLHAACNGKLFTRLKKLGLPGISVRITSSPHQSLGAIHASRAFPSGSSLEG